MGTKKITYNDKVSIVPPGVRENQVWDLDMNEIKRVVNDNADELIAMLGLLNLKEDSGNKQNTLSADPTNTKYPSVTAVLEALKAVNINVDSQPVYLKKTNLKGQLEEIEAEFGSVARSIKTNIKNLYQTGLARTDVDSSVISLINSTTIRITDVNKVLFVNTINPDVNTQALDDYLQDFGTLDFSINDTNTPVDLNERAIYFLGINANGDKVYRTVRAYDLDLCYLIRVAVANNNGVYSIITTDIPVMYFPDLAANPPSDRGRTVAANGKIEPSGEASISFKFSSFSMTKEAVNYRNNKLDPNYLSIPDSIGGQAGKFILGLPNFESLSVNIVDSTVINPKKWYLADGTVGSPDLADTKYQVYRVLITVDGKIIIQTKASTNANPQPGFNAIFDNVEDATKGLKSTNFPDLLHSGDAMPVGVFYMRAGAASNGSTMNDTNDFFYDPILASTSSSTVGATTHDSLSGKNDNPGFLHVTNTEKASWNSKEPAISTGSNGSYFADDKTWKALTTSAVVEGSRLYYTEARVSANVDVAAAKAKMHDKLTIISGSGLSLNEQELSLLYASGTTNGALRVSDWINFNSKAPEIHTHTVSQITDFPTFKTIENQSIFGAGNIDLNKSDVGLSNVDNTSDANKPVSTATQTALNAKANISGQVFTGAVSATNLSGTNTGDNAPNSLYSGLVTNATHTGEVTGSTALTITNGAVTNAKLANVATSTLKGRVAATTGVVEDLTASQVRTLLNVADGANNYVHPANHLASIITQDASNRFVTDTEKSAWNAKEPAIASGTISQYWRGDKTWQPFPAQATVDQTIIDGSTNAVSGNAVFDGLALKADISSVHNPVTIGTANGLSLSTQQLSLGLSSSGVTGALSGTDWNTFNGKFPTPTGLATNYLPKWNGSGFGNSTIFDNGTNVGIGTTNPSGVFCVQGGEVKIRTSNFNFGTLGAALTLGVDQSGNFARILAGKNGDSVSTNLVFQEFGGNTLFGTTTDNGVDKIQINGSGSFSGEVKSGASFSTSDQSAYYFRGGTHPLDAAVYGSGVNKFVDIWTNQAQKARFDVNGLTVNGSGSFSGNIKIGNPQVSSQKLNVEGSLVSIDNKLQYLRMGMEGGTAVITTDWFSGAGGSPRPMEFKTGGVTRFIIDQVGNIIANNSITASPAVSPNQVVVKSQLDAVASGTVNLTGNQTIAGIKTFSGAIIGTTANFSGAVTVPDPTNPFNAATKNYVDQNTRPYKVYTALLSQTGTNAPTAIVLENTLGGTPTLNYIGVGNYGVDLTGAFTSGKTGVIISNGTPLILSACRLSNDRVIINCGAGNDRITNATIEIRVYN